MGLNVSETHLVDDLVHLTDIASRVLGTAGQPGSHYQWDKARVLAAAAQRLADRLGGDTYQPLPDPIDPDRVRAAVATESRHYAIGKALYGSRSH